MVMPRATETVIIEYIRAHKDAVQLFFSRCESAHGRRAGRATENQANRETSYATSYSARVTDWATSSQRTSLWQPELLGPLSTQLLEERHLAPILVLAALVRHDLCPQQPQLGEVGGKLGDQLVVTVQEKGGQLGDAQPLAQRT